LAEDVVATINTIFAEDSEAAGKSNLGPVDNAEVVNDTTVQLNLTQPDFITEARWGITWAPIYPKDVVENRWDEMSTTDFGAGPFKVDNFSPGNEVAMSAYEDFPVTDDEGTKLPYMDGVTVSVTPDSSTMITEFLNQGTDLIRAVPFGQFSRLENADGVETQTTEVASFPVIQMRATEAPFDDNRVRTAFKLAVDREAIIASALNGYGTIGNDHPVGAAYLGHSELPEQRSQDMGRAEELLQEAGYGEGGESIDLEFKAPNNPQYVLDTTVLAAENFNQLSNVNVEVVQQSYDTWINETWLNSRFYTSWYGQEVRSALQLEITWHSEGAWNEANWSDDEFDTALENAIAAQSEEEYKSEIKTCEQILYERGPSIVPAFRPILSGHWDYVHGYEPARNESYVIADEMWIEDEAPTK
jgi:peptide/nickel transport system substrate-binding protein